MGEKKTKLMLYSTQLKLKLKLELSLAIENTEINSYRGVHIDMIKLFLVLFMSLRDYLWLCRAKFDYLWLSWVIPG